VLEADLASGDSIHFLATTDEWDAALALTAEQSLAAELERRSHLSEHFTADDEVARHLTLAADQFIVAAVSRAADVAQAHAAGDQPRTVIAGYHWFTDWGRDTMISLEGLTLATGRWEEARHILRTFSRHVRDGLIPNLFPEGEREGVYHTADATLWFFHALDRYTAWTNDRETVRALLPTIGEIIAHHLRGTRFGIGVDPDDGLLQQGAEGYQLTWMDAKVGDWVVTPRRGKAVEINALWYNALRVYSKWLAELAEDRSQAEQIDRHAELARNSFNHRFWDEARQCLYDVVDGPAGNDASLRPNQLFAIALPHPILDRARWEGVMKICMETLLTPMGLRSLAPGEPNYVPVYDGDLRARDAAYHQGTVWGWLVGPLVDSWLKTHPDDRNTVRAFLEGFVANLHEACIGTMNEIFDAEAPYTPRGCVAQAWTVAEVLRCWQKTSPAKETA
jgi:predicted glycogen debranching enzyme